MTDKISKEAFEYLNQIRANPKAAVAPLQEQLALFKGKILNIKGEIPLQTQEGPDAVKECIQFLQSQKPLPALKFEALLANAAKDHADDIGPQGVTGHDGTDGSSMTDRIERYGEWGGHVGENISFGSKSGKAAILQLIVDDGVRNRGHRANCFNADYKLVGIASGTHTEYGSVCVMDFCTEITPNKQGINIDQSPAGKRGEQPQQRGGLLPDKQVNKVLAPPNKPAPTSARNQQPAPVAAKKGADPKAFDPDVYVKPNLPREEVKEIKQAFDIFDNDGSGTIDPSELRAAFEELGYKGQNKLIYQVLGELDEDNSGGIDFSEFLKLATAKVSNKDNKDQIQKVFNMYDWNKEGRITWDELKRVAADLGEDMSDEEVLEMFQKADLDDDGFVTFEDFYNIMTGKVYWD